MNQMPISYQQQLHTGGYRFTAKLRTKRHNGTFLLLHQLDQTTTGERWPVIGLDLGNKSVSDINKHYTDIKETNPSQLFQILRPEHELLRNDKLNTPHQP